MVGSSVLLDRDQTFRDIYKPYALYLLKIISDYPKVQLLTVHCPSRICEYLGTTTFTSFYFYRDGERKAKLTDGEEMSVYLKTMEDVLGENKL